MLALRISPPLATEISNGLGFTSRAIETACYHPKDQRLDTFGGKARIPCSFQHRGQRRTSRRALKRLHDCCAWTGKARWTPDIENRSEQCPKLFACERPLPLLKPIGLHFLKGQAAGPEGVAKRLASIVAGQISNLGNFDRRIACSLDFLQIGS